MDIKFYMETGQRGFTDGINIQVLPFTESESCCPYLYEYKPGGIGYLYIHLDKDKNNEPYLSLTVSSGGGVLMNFCSNCGEQINLIKVDKPIPPDMRSIKSSGDGM